MHFKVQLIIRLALLSINIYVLASLDTEPAYRATLVGLILLALLQVWWLIHFLDKTNKQVLRLLNSIRYDDFTELYNAEGKGTNVLAHRMNEVVQKFREIRAEKEAQLHYLEVIVQHIGIGIITFKPNGNILLQNNAAKQLLKTGQLKLVQELYSCCPDLAKALSNLEHGDKVVVPLRIGEEQVNLSVHLIELAMLGEKVKLVSLQNIQNELEEKEMEAWSNLIRVLTHEIMNSVTPIASLSASAYEEASSYSDSSKEEVTLLKEELDDLAQCLHTISRRSDSLIRFVSEFRSLTKVAVPQMERFDVTELLQDVKVLMREQLAERAVQLKVEVSHKQMWLTADRAMIEQILINLVKNAIEALDDKPNGLIVVRANLDERSRVNLEVEDNGQGMTPEAADKIFIPFYTTKKSGSGIGLSLSRQIMRLHAGTITVKTSLGQGTRFILRF